MLGGSVWKSVQEFEDDILNVSTGFDLLLIMACRRLISQFLLANCDTLVNGIALGDAILPSYPDVR